MVQFRKAIEADFQEICNLVKSDSELFLVYPSGNYPLTVEQVRYLSTVRIELTVATENQKIIGFANLYDYEVSKSAFIGNVIVDEAYRARGIGRRIVAQMMNLSFLKHNLQEVCISVFSHNIPALLLYAGFGFTPYQIEERKDYANKRVALIHMKMNKLDYQKTKNSFSRSDRPLQLGNPGR